MLSRRLAALIAALALVLGAVVIAGCGDDDDEPSGGGSNSSQEEKPAIKVGLVTDIGGLDDRSFNQLANEGLERAKSELERGARAVPDLRRPSPGCAPGGRSADHPRLG